jgi:hypothetical protein
MLMFSVSFSATCIVHGIIYMLDQMESLDDDDDDLTSLYGTAPCSKCCQLKVSMINLIEHLFLLVTAEFISFCSSVFPGKNLLFKLPVECSNNFAISGMHRTILRFRSSISS